MTDYPLSVAVLSYFAEKLSLVDIQQLKLGATLSPKRLAVAIRRSLKQLNKKLRCQQGLLTIRRVRNAVVVEISLKFLQNLNQPSLMKMKEELTLDAFGMIIQDVFGRLIGVFEFTDRTWSIFFPALTDPLPEEIGVRSRAARPHGIESVRTGHWVTSSL